MEVCEISDEDIGRLLKEVHDAHGYDFSQYSKASLKRRISRLFHLDRFANFDAFILHLQLEPAYLKRFLEEVTVGVTEMFRDPGFYRAIQTTILPVLATYPLIRIWHAGCSTGEEVYSMAILLHEANLLHKSLLYATDINASVLETATKAVYPLENMLVYEESYKEAGGKADFKSYYSSKYNLAKMNDSLKSKIVFATHNLVSDRSFNEFQLVLCRNVLIYFNKPLQEKVITLFHESLETLGFLALGSKETLRFSTLAPSYKQVDKEKIWRKIV